MIFNFLTGLLSVIFIAFCLSYLQRRQWKKPNVIKKLNFHCLSGYLALLIILIHIHFRFFDLKLTAGSISFAALLLISLTGFLKQRFRKKRIFYTVHLGLVAVFIFTVLIHIVQQIINLLLM